MYVISVNTFWTIWLLVHLMLAVFLLGALTHQAVSVMMPVRQVAGPGGFVTRFRAVPAAGYATAVCVLWVLTFIVGSYIYTKYRIYIRIPIEQAGYWNTQGFFDFKEHVATICLTLLPAYWLFWKNAQNPCLAFLKGSAGSEMLWRRNAPERALAEQPSEPRAVESVAPRTVCADTEAVPYSKGCIAFMTGWFWQPNGP
jgi:hypothetical protein